MSRPSGPSVDGILNLNKLPYCTSMDMVRLVKRLTHVRHVGHGGTLDPLATGVLPICFGQATRIMEYLIQSRKVYRAQLRLGISTDTYDSQGTPTEERNPSMVTRAQVEAALAQFTGVIDQQPPMYSAVKHQGKRLYQLARAGIEVPRDARRVHVYLLRLEEWTPPLFTLQVECGRGVYMRSLAHDLGQALGCGAHLDSLVRQRSGPFSIEESFSVEQLQRMVGDGTWQSALHPLDIVLTDLEAVEVDGRAERSLGSGQPVPLSPRTHYALHMERRRAYAPDGRFVGVVQFNKAKELWQPNKVFHLSTPSPYAPCGTPTP